MSPSNGCDLAIVIHDSEPDRPADAISFMILARAQSFPAAITVLQLV
jgi:hypothetical protein